MALSGMTSAAGCGGEAEPQPSRAVPVEEPPAEVRNEPAPPDLVPGATTAHGVLDGPPLDTMPMPCLIGAIPGEDGRLGPTPPGGLGLGTLGAPPAAPPAPSGEPEGPHRDVP